MTLKLLFTGKTFQDYIREGTDEFLHRLARYCRMETVIIPDIKAPGTMTPQLRRQKEGQLILRSVGPADHVVLLDEKGQQYTSVQFASNLQDKMNSGLKSLVFIVGGAYGFDEAVYQRANEKLSLSKMTFSHQMVRLFLAEQLYRAFTILKNEPYHNE